MKNLLVLSVAFVLLLVGCGDDSNESEAVRRGIGAACAVDTDCPTEGTRCLTQFKGGYCGKSPCTADAECPAGSACITHEDGVNYCFLVCVDKAQCNAHRALENESNCSSKLTPVESKDTKACVPPSSG